MKIGVVGWGEIGRHHASHFPPNGAELGAVVEHPNGPVVIHSVVLP